MKSFGYALYVFLLVKDLAAQCFFKFNNSSHGYVTSPDYPNNYPAGISCVWLIEAPANHYVQLEFEDFDVEPFESCKTDVLEIKDGGNKFSPMIGGQYCNTHRPPRVVTSSAQHLRLWFAADSTVQHRGFKWKYKVVKDTGCGGDVHGTHGVITSPRFPLTYPNNIVCEWNVHVPRGMYLSMKFLHFDVETTCAVGKACACADSVSIEDKRAPYLEANGNYCFYPPIAFVSSSNTITLRFTADLYGRMSGFKAVFMQSQTKVCGGELFLSNGTIESPFFLPDAGFTYPPYTDCVWTYEGAADVQFTYMDVIGGMSCEQDYVEIKDNSTLLGNEGRTRFVSIHLDFLPSLQGGFVMQTKVKTPCE